jgi:hypothetical protein
VTMEQDRRIELPKYPRDCAVDRAGETEAGTDT